MTEGDENTGESFPEPRIKERDEGIIEAFAREDHDVLTSSEISEHVSVTRKTVNRRLEDLDDDGVVGTRTAGGVKLAWLEQDVKEPITVQYPLLAYVRDRSSVQFALVGVALGIIAGMIVLSVIVSSQYGVPLLFTNREDLLIIGNVLAAGSALFVVVSLITLVIERVYFGALKD